MKQLTKQLLLIISTLLPISLLSQAPAKVELPEVDLNRILFEKASGLRYYYPDSSLLLLEVCFNNFMEKGDTLNAAYTLREQARIYGHQAHYKDSYDKLWKALLLADEAKLEKMRAIVYIDIGYYYSYYKRKEKAIEYFDLALSINKELVEKGLLDQAFLADNYFAYCSTFRGINKLELAKLYLDSSFQFHSTTVSDININYLEIEKAFHLKEAEKYDEAIFTFQKTLPWIQENDPGYQVLVYTYMGDAHREKGDFTQSEKCYKTAVESSIKYNSHLDFSPLVYERLAALYHWKGDLESAFQSLQTVKELDEKFFDSRSENNRPLLEIQDAFRLEKEEQKKLLQEQKLAQLEHEERVLFLQRTILMISLVFIILIGVIYFNYVRSKHKAEKQLIRKKQELEIQKANEIVELKNKELSASTLKLIEKDEFISTLKEKLSKKSSDVDIQEIKRVVHIMSAGNEDNWKEFEARFIQVNKNFYNNIKIKYPKLTQGDLKLCALIKLNFSSKDMARLMGISVESVHTTRYRLRKKLKLVRDENLTEFIAGF